MYVEGDVPNVVNGGSNGGFGWGGDAWVMIILFALIFGWGNNGWGGNGGNNGALTRNDLCSEFNFNGLENSVRGIQNGLCDGFYAMNSTLLNGFNTTNTSILTSANATQNGIADLGYRIQSCCCDLGRGQDRIACEAATNAANIIQAGNANTQRILDFMCNEKISSLQAENALLTSQLSQNSQTNTIINALRPVAQPAYITCSPFESAYGFYGRNGNNGCGCGCGCN